MARKWSNLNLAGALHYVTGNFLDRTAVFTDPECCKVFLDELQKLNRNWPSKLITHVLMPKICQRLLLVGLSIISLTG